MIALLVLGPGKLPEVGTALGKSIREFRKAASDVKEAASIDPIATEAPKPNVLTPRPPAAAPDAAPDATSAADTTPGSDSETPAS